MKEWIPCSDEDVSRIIVLQLRVKNCSVNNLFSENIEKSVFIKGGPLTVMVELSSFSKKYGPMMPPLRKPHHIRWVPCAHPPRSK